jgi:transcriptional regulator with XRE-family HTH domain
MKLADYLAIRGVTPSRFASEAGLQPSTVIRILNGERPTPSIETLAKIMRASQGQVTPNDFASKFIEPSEAAR